MIKLPLAVQPVWRFSVHLASGSVAFLAVFCFAAGVGQIVYLFEAMGWASRDELDPARMAAMVIYWMDLLTLALFLVNETLKMLRSYLEDWF